MDRRGKNQFILGLPRCNMNSKIQILGKSKVFTEKSQTESHFRQTNISRDLLSVCEVRRSDKCSSISIFAVIYLKLLVQIDSLFSLKYCRRRKKSPQTFLDAKTVAKTGQTTPIRNDCKGRLFKTKPNLGCGLRNHWASRYHF